MFRRIGYSIIRLILLIRNYGSFTGIQLWKQIAFSFSKEITLKSALFRNTVNLRKHDSDLAIFDQIFVDRQYQWFGSEKLQPKVIVDAGANIGLAALYFAAKFPGAHIYCIEPDTHNFQLLQKNLRHYGNVHTLQGALWYKDEYLEIANPEGFSAGLSMKSAATSQKIQGYSVASVMQHFGLTHIDILKMDIEGAEKEVFAHGDTEWLKKVSVLVIELHDMYKDGTAAAFFQVLHNRFEKMYVQGENLVFFLKQPLFNASTDA